MKSTQDYTDFTCTHIERTDRADSDENTALAYADIDGWPQSDEEGTVICRVWLLGVAPAKFIVDWHHNGYRLHTPVREQIDYAKEQMIDLIKGIS